MLHWIANRVAKRIDLETLANRIEVKLSDRLNERIDSRLRDHKIKDAIVDKLKNPSRIIYGITGEQAPVSGPYFLKEDPRYRTRFRKGDTFPYHQIGAKKIQVTWIFDPPERKVDVVESVSGGISGAAHN